MSCNISSFIEIRTHELHHNMIRNPLIYGACFILSNIQKTVYQLFTFLVHS